MGLSKSLKGAGKKSIAHSFSPLLAHSNICLLQNFLYFAYESTSDIDTVYNLTCSYTFLS